MREGQVFFKQGLLCQKDDSLNNFFFRARAPGDGHLAESKADVVFILITRNQTYHGVMTHQRHADGS